MKILILMGGRRVEGRNESYPIYMVEIDRKMILETQLEKSLTLKPSEIICCVRQEDVTDFHVDDIIRHNAKSARCALIRNRTAGALCTALLAIDRLENDEELLVLASNEMLDTDYNVILTFFRQGGFDCGLVSFPATHPRYSFARVDKSGFVCEVAEKRPISKNALASFFWFKKSSDFVCCAKDVIRKDNPLNGAFFVSQAINEMILQQKRVGLYAVEATAYHPLKTEMQLLQYIQEKKS